MFLIDRLPRDARRYVPRQPSDVEMLVIHHTAAPPETSLQDIATAHRADWPGIIYDFVIDGQG